MGIIFYLLSICLLYMCYSDMCYSACMLSAFILQLYVGMLCLYFLLLHLFCNYFRLCVDVGTHVATSWCLNVDRESVLSNFILYMFLADVHENVGTCM